MALFVRQNEKRSQLQEKLAADLRTKLDQSSIEAEKTDPTIVEDTNQTRPAGLAIGLIVFLIFVVVVVTMFILG